jgi:hypothetical protein
MKPGLTSKRMISAEFSCCSISSSHVEPGSSSRSYTASKSSIDDFDNALWHFTNDGVSEKRNLLAHGTIITQNVAQSLRNSIIGNKGIPGFLTWIVENLDP